MPLDGNVPGILSVHAAHQWGQIAVDDQHIALDVHQLSDDRVICVLSVWKYSWSSIGAFCFSGDALKGFIIIF